MRTAVKAVQSHYDYLDITIDNFGKAVLPENEQNYFNEGLIVAHGDKCYSYMTDAKEEHGIHGHRFAMLYLLTYTSLMDRPKSESYNWVVSHYDNFLPYLQAAEKAAGIDHLYTDSV